MASVRRISITQANGDTDERDIGAKASDLTYNNADSTFQSTDVQKVLDEISDKFESMGGDSDKMDKVNPAGSGSLSINRLANSVAGDYSVAIGENNVASGRGSIAEGGSTTATGVNSHAEGYGTSAGSAYSHAEGESTTASGNSSHAEGSQGVASGAYSHTEGYNSKASGDSAHAGGRESEATGAASFSHGTSAKAKKNNSVALGNNVTVTADNECVIGTYNDANPAYTSSPIFVVGVGDSAAPADGFTVLADGTAIVKTDIKIKDGLSLSTLAEEFTEFKNSVKNVEGVKF